MILLDGHSLTLDGLVAIADEGAAVGLAPAAAARVDAARAVVDRKAAGDEAVYGINTGFGALADTAIPRGALGALQLNLLRSHAAGVGEPLPVRAVRASMALRANVLAKGFSGIRRVTLERLIDLLNRRVHPRVPSRGSVGASGDLAPLAHLALVLVGEGQATVGDGAAALPGRDALARRRARARGARTQGRARAHQRHAAVHRRRGARAWPAPSAWRAPPTSPRRSRSTRCAAPCIPSTRESTPRGRTPASRASAANILALLSGSAINRSHEHCGRVQDAYSLRCAAQVHGAARDALRFVRGHGLDRGQRRDRQPDGVRRRGRDRVGRELPRRSGRRSRPTWRRLRSPSS